MFPLKDDNPTHRFPVLTVALIVLCVAVYAFQATKPNPETFTTERQFDESQSALICEYGMIPDRILDGQAPRQDICVAYNERQPRVLPLVSHQFVHADLLHLAGNMLFLWVFGNNVEDRLGRIRFLPFFLLCGIIAALGQALTDPTSLAPMIGASGAIRGVLGAYLILFPRARVLTLLGIIPLRLPAWMVLGLYMLFQFLYVSQQAQEGAGGVAYWAHIVGFGAGMALIVPFLAGRPWPRAGAPGFSRR